MTRCQRADLGHDDLLDHAQAKCYFKLFFMPLIYFIYLLYMLLSALSIPPPRHARGLGHANT
jgi:hypothetical protein